MRAIPQLVSALLNPIPIAEHFRRNHPPCEHSHGQHIIKTKFPYVRNWQNSLANYTDNQGENACM